jgi:D-alanine--poly(phosphoribitol) ligase subunit 2
MTDSNAIIEHLRRLFVERFHIEVPSADMDLLATGVLDSLQFVELLLQIEQQFGIQVAIEDIDLDDLRSLARIGRMVAGSIDEAAGAPYRMAELCTAGRDALETQPGRAQLSAPDARTWGKSTTQPSIDSSPSYASAQWADSATHERK